MLIDMVWSLRLLIAVPPCAEGEQVAHCATVPRYAEWVPLPAALIGVDVLQLGSFRRGRLRAPLRFPRLGCWQLGRGDAQQLAKPFGIVPSIGLDEHLRFGTRIRRGVRHRFGMDAADAVGFTKS
jgi:hypothetical protein